MSDSGAHAPLTVLWVVSTFPTPANPTRGVFIEEQAAQVGRRCRLHILALVPWYPPLPRYQDARTLLSTLPVSANYPTFTVHYLRVPYVARWWLPTNLVRAASLALATLWSVVWLWRWSERPALIHAHMGTNAPTGAALAWLARAPLVTTVHGSDVNYGLARGAGNWFRRWTMVLGLKASRVVVGVSEALRGRVIALGLPESRVVHIPNGFDEARFRQMETSEARGKLGLPSFAKIVVCVSGLVPVKGVDVLLEAFSRLHHGSDDPILYCVGDGPERSKLESRAKASDLKRGVHFVGARPHEEIPLWMNACDVFAMASRNEGWPTVLSEALACGKRVVATAVGGVPEILRDEYLGTLVPPDEPEALAEAIRHALDSPADSDRIASYAQRFTWSSVGSRVKDAYDQALGGGSSARETSQP